MYQGWPVSDDPYLSSAPARPTVSMNLYSEAGSSGYKKLEKFASASEAIIATSYSTVVDYTYAHD